MLTIIAAAGLLVHGSITVDAADSYTQAYILYDATSGEVYVSDYQIRIASSLSGSTSSSFIDCIGALGSLAFRLYYNDALQDWCASEVTSSDFGYCYILGTSTSASGQKLIDGSSAVKKAKVYTNASWSAAERNAVASYSTDLTVLPQGLSDGTVQEIVDEQLNTQTAVGTQAAQIITDTTAAYSSYQSGDITSTEMQSLVDNNLDTLSELSATTGNTLSDLMQINNAITYNQAIQDGLLHTASGNVQSMIQGYTTTINNAVTDYQSGAVSQADTVKTIQQQIDNLNAMITNGTAATTADVNAVNAAINAANGSLDSVTGYKDLDPSVSDKMQQSDVEELALLDEMQTTMEQQQIQNPLQDSETVADAVEVRDTIADIWVNKYMVLLTTMFAMLVVVCIVLKTRYRMM